MEGVERYKVRLLPHSGEWEKEFISVKKLLTDILGADALDIQHVGSTAILGICAKPILDVAVRVVSFSSLNIEGMKRNGYEDCGESGVPGRRLFVLRKDGSISLHHIHCYEADNMDFENLVRFRDYLNSHPDYAIQYDELKLSLAERYPNDRILYTNGKESFIQNILKRANQEHQ
jgi:GrpB-like predicted nucleotidyltransferase (UPF0157 family)